MIGLLAAAALMLDVTAARPIPRGTVLGVSDLEGEARNVALLIGLEARRPIFKGQVVDADDLAPPMAVRRQSTVTVLFIRGPLTLKTEGRAMKEGRVGEGVDVLLPGRRQAITATIVAPSTVEVN